MPDWTKEGPSQKQASKLRSVGSVTEASAWLGYMSPRAEAGQRYCWTVELAGQRGKAMYETWWRRREAQPPIPECELRFMMKLGRLERDEAIRLLGRYHGDREAVYAALGTRDLVRERNARPH